MTTTRSPALIGGSMLVAGAIALIWFKLPLVPVLTGAIGAGVLLYWRAHREGRQDGAVGRRMR